ncbi:MAG: hypothetical protein QME12_08010 [Nanoarchaeota archaeon]|nr:hypothetical protein [Nanoarchaeota archaeon]
MKKKQLEKDVSFSRLKPPFLKRARKNLAVAGLIMDISDKDDFKTLKDKLLIPVKPINHRLDHRIRAHIFICVLATVMYRYLLWKVKNQGLTEKQVVDELRTMRLAFVKQEDGSVRKVMETMNPAQINLYSMLHLERFMP